MANFSLQLFSLFFFHLLLIDDTIRFALKLCTQSKFGSFLRFASFIFRPRQLIALEIKKKTFLYFRNSNIVFTTHEKNMYKESKKKQRTFTFEPEWCFTYMAGTSLLVNMS